MCACAELRPTCELAGLLRVTGSQRRLRRSTASMRWPTRDDFIGNRTCTTSGGLRLPTNRSHHVSKPHSRRYNPTMFAVPERLAFAEVYEWTSTQHDGATNRGQPHDGGSQGTGRRRADPWTRCGRRPASTCRTRFAASEARSAIHASTTQPPLQYPNRSPGSYFIGRPSNTRRNCSAVASCWTGTGIT